MTQEMVGEGGLPYDGRSSAYIPTYRDYIGDIKCCILQHFLAKLDAQKNDDSNRGAIKSLQEI